MHATALESSRRRFQPKGAQNTIAGNTNPALESDANWEEPDTDFAANDGGVVLTVRVTGVAVPVAFTEVGLNWQVTSAGNPLQAKVTADGQSSLCAYLPQAYRL